MEKKTNKELLDFYFEGYKNISKKEIDKLENKCLKTIIQTIKKYKRIVVGYSLGKDSIVIDNMMKKIGVDYNQAYFRTMFHFSEVKKWYNIHRSTNSTCIEIPRPNWNDLEKDESLLFTLDKKADTKWMSFKWKTQQKYLKEYKCDLFITGRRIQESNKCGARKDNFIVNGKIYDTFSPIAEWSTDQVIAYIRYNNLELPPNYLNYENGFAYGSVAWAERRRFGQFDNDINKRWDEIYNIEKEIVYEASKHLTSAKKYLDRRKNNEIRSSKS